MLFVRESFVFKAMILANRMAEKGDRKSKRSQNTQDTPETRNLAVLELRMCVSYVFER